VGSFKNELAGDDWPLFPKQSDQLIADSELTERCQVMAEYLRRVLTYPPFRENTSVLNLLGVSHLTFAIGLGQSYLEGPLQKRTCDNNSPTLLQSLCNIFKQYDQRWFILKDTYIAYVNPSLNYELGFVILMDKQFECEMRKNARAVYGIEVKNAQVTFMLKCKSMQEQKDWHERVHSVLASTGRFFHDQTYLRCDSFAPNRFDQVARWYVNASGYMEHVMLALNNAQEEIFIADWWLSPELFLKRPTIDLQYRLDKILLKKATQGVRIYILLYKEVSLAVHLMSSRAKKILTQNGQSTNIKVLRHCSDALLWSHHDKCVIIDQSVAFMGGIDLCFGRWDDDLHRYLVWVPVDLLILKGVLLMQLHISLKAC
jgi:phospholipase D1/2